MLSSSGEHGYEFPVGRQEIQFMQSLRPAPLHFLEGLVAHLVRLHCRCKENQIDGFAQFSVLMVRTIYFRTDSCGNSEFLPQLSRQGFRGSLVRLLFSSGKFPHQAERIGAPPLADQQFAVRFD